MPEALRSSQPLSPKPMRTPSPLLAENPPRRDTVAALSSHEAVANEEELVKILEEVVPSIRVAAGAVNKVITTMIAAAVDQILGVDVVLDGKTTTSQLETEMLPSTSRLTGSYSRKSTSTDWPS